MYYDSHGAGGWAAANIRQSPDDKKDDQSKDAGKDERSIEDEEESSSKSDEDVIISNKRSRETVEAAVARLTTCYHSALQCVAAMRRVDSCYSTSSSQDDSITQEIIQRLAQAARRLLQNTILVDPLIRVHSPTTWTQLWKLDTNSSTNYYYTRRTAAYSSTHRRALCKLAYLSLVNYADLLMLSSSSSSSSQKDIMVLDRGVVPPLQCRVRLWPEEEEEESVVTTLHLALTAYMDATQIDDTDPILWLKLACAARAWSQVERITFCQHPCTVDCHLLETYAIHRGISVVPSHTIPSNSLLIRAMNSIQYEYEDSTMPILSSKKKVIVDATQYTLQIDLTRYSWNSLGRSLMRACRDTSTFPIQIQYYCNNNKDDLWTLPANTTNNNNTIATYRIADGIGSPTVEIHMAPIIAYLPVSNYAIVCDFLVGEEDVPRFEATCRAISSAIMTARTMMEEDQVIRKNPPPPPPSNNNTSSSGSIMEHFYETKRNHNNGEMELQEGNHSDREESTEIQEEDPVVADNNAADNTTREEQDQPPFSQEDDNCPTKSPRRRGQNRGSTSSTTRRARSQRLLTQQDRHQTDLTQQQHLLEKCVTFSIFGCKVGDPLLQSLAAAAITTYISSSGGDEVNETNQQQQAEAIMDWFDLPPLRKTADVLRQTRIFRKYNNVEEENGGDGTHMESKDKIVLPSSSFVDIRRNSEIKSRISLASLNSFVQSTHNSGPPLNILTKFLAHVSLHVQDVFLSEQANDGVMMLSSCLLDCFDLIANCQGQLLRSLVAPYWVGSIQPATLLQLISTPREYCAISDSQQLEVFSMNLLVAELKLRRCDRQQMELDDIDSDAVAVSYIVSTLAEIITARNNASLEEKLENQIMWTALETRTHWLASTFYLWSSRSSVVPSVSSCAEEQSLNHLDLAVQSLEKPMARPVKVIFTPHLDSPSRSGKHWKELSKSTLMAYKDEIQAASIVSRTRLEFMDIRNRVQACGKEGQAVDIDLNAEYLRLKSLGVDLLKRYDYEYKHHGGRYEDLVRDFLSSSNIREMLLEADKASKLGIASLRLESIYQTDTSSEETNSIMKWDIFLWSLIPSSIDSAKLQFSGNSSNPSLVEILAVCCMLEPELQLSLLQVLVRLVISAFDQRSKIQALREKSSGNGISHQNILSDRDSYSESSEEGESDTDGDPTKRRGVDKSGYLLILVAEFFMEKIAHLCTVIAPKLNNGSQSYLAFSDFSTSTEVLAMLQISVSLAAKSNDLVDSFPSKVKLDHEQSHNAIIFRSDTQNARSAISKTLSCLPERVLLLISYVLVHSLLYCEGRDDDGPHPLECAFFLLLSKVLVEEQTSLAALLLQRGDRRHRSTKQRACLAKGNFIADVAIIFSDLLLRFPFKSVDGVLLPSPIIQSVLATPVISKEQQIPIAFRSIASMLELAPLVQISESLLWFWIHFSTDGAADTGHNAFHASEAANVISLAQRLETPMASALLSFCGSSVNSGLFYLADSDEVGDTEDNEVDCMSNFSSSGDDDDSDRRPAAAPSRKRSFKALAHMVKVFSVVFSKLKDRNACSIFAPVSGSHGPLLPLAVSKTLNNVADFFLDYQITGPSMIWSIAYPKGYRKAGLEIDALLAKACSCLHGFSLLLLSTTKECNLIGGSQDTARTTAIFQPESAKAALSLFRLIKRIYPSNGRRNPPRLALEIVSKSLPDVKGKARDKSVRDFIFSSPIQQNEPDALPHFEQSENIGLNPSLFNFPLWILEEASDSSAAVEQDGIVEEQDFVGIPSEILRSMRVELTRDLARGPMPRMGSNNSIFKNSSSINEDAHEGCHGDERDVLARYELEVWQKVNSIIDYLCLSPGEYKAWFDVAHCLSYKAYYIRDRVVTHEDERIERDFFPWRKRNSQLCNLQDLEKQHTFQDDEVRRRWLPCIGRDLSVYLRHPWSTVSTLHDCAEEISNIVFNENEDIQEETVFVPENRQLAEIEALTFIDSLEPGEWQNAWGGLYIGALQIMADRCLKVTYYLTKQNENELRTSCNEDHVRAIQLVAEACESMGTALYSELQGSWQYGYPIHRMTQKSKCNLAGEAAAKYEEARDLVLRSTSGNEDFNATWGLKLMIGKCYEKMANTYRLELFPVDDNNQQYHSSSSARKYEDLLSLAFSSYSESLVAVKRAEEEGLLSEQQKGGCAHGSIEVVYRIHATRLKVLLYAIYQASKNRHCFEAEALHLVSRNWFAEPVTENEEELNWKYDSRDRRWEVLVDIVSALVFCRKEKALFHRSVFRHAQAILWAPVVYSPDVKTYPLFTAPEDVVAQTNTLSNIFRCGIHVHAAKIVMDSLFDKKRAQLCATWMSSRSHRAFEELNTSEKKFDSVRLKYISARIELLRVCRDHVSLETFFSWANACPPDLPSLYFATALDSAASRQNHFRQNLLEDRGFLRHVKRLCTMAIADVVLYQLRNAKGKEEASDEIQNTVLNGILKRAYSCFLKLNCTVENVKNWLEKTGEESFIELDALLCSFDEVGGKVSESEVLECPAEDLEADDAMNKKATNKKLTLLESALTRCKTMFSRRRNRRKSDEENVDTNTEVHASTESDVFPSKRHKKVERLVED